MRSPRYTPPVEDWAVRRNTRKLLQTTHTPNGSNPTDLTVKSVSKHTDTTPGQRRAKVRVRPTAAAAKPKRETRLAKRALDLSGAEVEKLIEEYDPRTRRPQLCSAELWEREGENVKRIVRTAVAADPALSVKASLSTLTALLVWAEKEALGLTAEEALACHHVDTYSARLARAGASRRTILRRIAEANGQDLSASRVTIGKTPLQPPYTEGEIQTLLAHASALTNGHRKKLLTAMIGLGAGVGLVRGAQRGVCKNALHHHSGTSKNDSHHNNTPPQETLHLKHNGICRPVHPLLSSALLALEDDGEAFISLGLGKNYLSRANTLLKRTPGTPHLNPDRLRAFYVTWILSIGLPLKDTLLILDLKKPGSLQAYLEFLPEAKKACDE